MIEILRQKRNRDQLSLMHPEARARMTRLLLEIEWRGYRPRLQETYRTQAQQLEKWGAGLSRIRTAGPHTCTVDGKPASLATHVLDDTDPIAAGAVWWARLAIVARQNGLQTGLCFGLTDSVHRQKIEAAIQGGLVGVLAILVTHERGFDPLHVEMINWKGFMP